MSEKAQEVRKRRLGIMEYLRNSAKITFDFVLNALDEKTEKGDYLPFNLFIAPHGISCTSFDVNYRKDCDDVKIGLHYHYLFFKMLEEMFNDEEGFTAKFLLETMILEVMDMEQKP